MQPVRAKYFVNRPITFCDWNGANVPPKSVQNAPKPREWFFAQDNSANPQMKHARFYPFRFVSAYDFHPCRLAKSLMA